jgi:hypothetical protein
MIFVLGGIFPLALVLVLAFWLPESPRFLATKKKLSPRDATLLQRLDIASAHRDAIDVVRLADRSSVDHFLLQPFEPLLIRVLDADGVESARRKSSASCVCVKP